MSSVVWQPYYNEPGITRDGTPFDSQTYIDGEWVRFYKKKPKKMGGFKNLNNKSPDIIRTVESFSIGNTIYLVSGTHSDVFFSELSEGSDPSASSPKNITPSLMSKDTNNVWTFEFVFCERYDPSSGRNLPPARYLLAQVAPTLGNLSNTTTGRLYYLELSKKSIAAGTVLAEVWDYQSDINEPVPVECTGSIAVIGSYIFAFGNNGSIRWNNGTNLNAWSVSAPIEGGKAVSALGGGFTIFGGENFVTAFPFRSGNSLAGIFWSTTAAIYCSYAGRSPDDKNVNFSFSYLSTLSTCLSPTSICSVEPLFFWVGLNTFYMYNGSITEVANETNKVFFFENLNEAEAGKIYSFVNLRYHEWWILFPKGNSLECNHALIYNYEYQCWYDTPIERAAAIRYSNILYRPVLSSNFRDAESGRFSLYLHEFGLDNVNTQGKAAAIQSSITAYVSKELGNNISSQAVLVNSLILDIRQKKKMRVTFHLLAYPRSAFSPIEIDFEESEDRLTLTEKGTIIAISFISKEIGGDYHMGKTLVEYTVTNELRAAGSESLK